ncbi:MAG TPA: PQQ-binding-like beta-propeller repeat protein [Pyrinomonadaceae bacterium]
MQELLDQSLREFQQHQIPLRAEELAIINPYRQELSLTSDAQKLIAVSERKLKLRRRFAISFGGFVAVLAVATAILMIFALRARQTIRNADESMRLLFENNGLIPLGLNPHGLAFDGKRLWVANTASPRLQAINPNTGKIENVVTLDHASGVLLFDGKRLWVSSAVDRSVQAVDPETGKLGRKVQLAERTQALLSDGQKIWVLYFDMPGNDRNGAVQAVNPETGAIDAPIAVVDDAEAIAFDGKRIWIASKNDGQVQSVDPVSREASNPIPVGMQPDMMRKSAVPCRSNS